MKPLIFAIENAVLNPIKGGIKGGKNGFAPHFAPNSASRLGCIGSPLYQGAELTANDGKADKANKKAAGTFGLRRLMI